MIIFRYLLKEVTKTQLSVFLVIMTIFISNKFVRLLDDASEGNIPGYLIMTFIGLKIPDLAGMILPLSLFLGVLLAYSRIYSENEMTVLHACGVSEWYVVRVTLTLAIISALLTGLFTLYLSPMAAEYEYQLKAEIAADSGLSSLIAGRFQTTGNNKAVVFIHDKNRQDNTFNKVFVAQLPDSKDKNLRIIDSSLVYANNGKVEEDESGRQRLILSEGLRYQNDVENKQFQEVVFDKYQIQIQDKKISYQRRKLGAIPTLQLFQEKTAEAVAENQWRIAFPLVCIIMTLIAVPLSEVKPRQGKYGKMLPALLLFLSYFLLLTSLRSAIEKNIIPSFIGLWPVHFIVLILGIMLLIKGRKLGYNIKAKFLQSVGR